MKTTIRDFTIFLGGPIHYSSRLREQVSVTRIIAADSGVLHVKELDLKAELWMGDFDSSPHDVYEEFSYIPRIKYKRDKDKSDGQLAIEKAIELCGNNFILCGALAGPRTDHILNHINFARALVKQNYQVKLADGNQEAVMLHNNQEYIFDYPVGTIFSIINFTDLEGLTIKGAKWNLDNSSVSFASTLTTSNEVEGTLSVLLRSGEGMLIASLNL